MGCVADVEGVAVGLRRDGATTVAATAVLAGTPARPTTPSPVTPVTPPPAPVTPAPPPALTPEQYALNVEKTHTKDQILSGYLNLALYGDQAYGVEAAAQHFFSKHASELNLSESATLAGVVQSPSRLNPRTNPEEVQERRDLVINRMQSLGMVTPAQADAAKARSIILEQLGQA